MKKFKIGLIPLIIVFVASFVYAQNIPVVPKGFVKGKLKAKILFHPDSTIALEWMGNINNGGFKIKLGSQTGTYDFSNDYFPMNVAGTAAGDNVYRQTFTGGETALPTGRYYGIITNSQYNTINEISNDPNAVYSNEFQIIITATTAPTATEPLGTINNPTPVFSWNAIPGVVSYWLLLSSNPFEITTDSLGNIQIEGANLIWNYTTNQTSANYGDVNPLNPYDMGTPPPLLSGHTYNYVILNLYEENNPIFGSPVTSGVFSFTYEAENEQEPPELLTPADSSYFDATPEITFSWQSADWANLYTIYLYQRLTSFGGNDQTIDVPIWDATTTNTQITYDAGNSLTKGTYVWYVVPSDAQGAGTASETYTFYYNKELGVFRLQAKSAVDNSSLLNFQAEAVALEGGITPTNPFLVIDSETYTDSLAIGVYQFTGSKVGFLDTTITVEITAENTPENPRVIQFVFTPLPGIINGTVTENGTGLPVSNATVMLTNTVTNVSQTAVTNSNGNFTISTRYGSYYVFVTKEGYVSSDFIFFNLNQQQLTLDPITLTKDEATVSGKILNDAGEPVQLATVTATDGATSFQTNSSGEGDYSFTLTSGEWHISVAKTGFISPPSITVNLATGDNLQNQNLTLIPRAAHVSGTVYKVVNTGNTTTIPFANVTVTAEPLSGEATTVQTDGDGTFDFSLRYGTYVFYATQTGYTSSDPIQLTLSLGETVDNVNFTLTPNPSSISGRVKLADGSAVTNATITADNAVSAISDANGHYTLSLDEGTHTVTVSKEGYIPPSPRTISILPGENFTGIDFTLTPNAGTVAGKVLHNGSPVLNATVTASDGTSEVTAASDANGAYSISVQPGTWTVSASKSGFIASDPISVNVAPGQTSANNNFNLIQNIATINGVTRSNSIPLGNVNISIYDNASGELTLTTVSNSSGTFTAALEAGKTYRITANKTGYASDTEITPALEPESSLSLQFDLTPNPSSVSGTIYSSTSQTLAGATVTVTRPDGTVENTVISQSDGTYYAGVQANNYVITVTKPGYHTAQTTANVSVGENLTNIDFTLGENFATISGYVTDNHGNGISAVMVNAISDAGGRTVFTLGDGSFLLNRLIGGVYTVAFTKEGYSDTTVYNFTVADGENKTLNVNAELLNGEANGHVTTVAGAPVENATVKLLPNGKNYIYAVTDEDGFFRFSSLPEGEYTVSAEKAGYRSSLAIPFTISAQDSVVTVNINDFELNVAEISGSVYDAGSGVPLPNATVSISGNNGSASATTDNAGNFILSNIPPGDYQLAATLQNYYAAPLSVTITDTTHALTFNIAMTKTTGSISGKVTDENGSPLDFTVTIIASNNVNSYTTQTSEDGSFVFPEAEPASDYTVRTDIYREGYQNVSVENVTVTENQNTNLGELHPVISLSEIYGNAGTDNAYITLQNLADGTTSIRTSNALGEYAFNYLTAGNYTLTVQKEGYEFSPASADVTLSVYEEKEVNFSATAQIATLEIGAKDENGDALAGVSVTIVSADTSVVKSGETNTQGRALFRELPVNDYLVTATLEGYSATPVNRNVRLDAGDSVYVEFTLAQNSATFGGKITKRLANGNLRPLGEATVEARRTATGETFRTVSDENGNYALENLARDNYAVTVFKAGFTTATDEIDLTNGNVDNVNFTLEPEIVILRGSVISRNAEDADSLGIKAVSALGEFYALTDADGEYEFPELPVYPNENDTTVYNISIDDARFSSVSRQIRIPGAALNTEITAEPFLLPSGEITVIAKECDAPLGNVSVTIIKPDGNVITKLTDNTGTVSTGTHLYAGEYAIGVTLNGYLLPANYSVTLASDTSSVSFEAQLPYKFEAVDEILSNAPTKISISFPKGCSDAAAGEAKVYYKIKSAALYQEAILTANDSSFAGEIPALFTTEKIDYYVSVNNNGVKYKSDVYEITPKAAGILTQVVFNPSLDNVVIRKGDNYKISLLLRDGVNNSLLDKFTGANHPGKIVWSVPEGFRYEFPNENDSTVILVNAEQTEGNQTIGVTATLDGISVSQSAIVNINALEISSLSISKPQSRISNRSAGIQFSLTGKDSTGRTVTLGSGITWSISPVTAISEEDYRYFAETGFYRPVDSSFVGVITVKAEDAISGLSDETTLSVYAEIYPNSSVTLTNGSGFTLSIVPQSVTVPIELEFGMKKNLSVKKYVTPLNSDKKYTAANSSYYISYNSSSALPGDSLQRRGTLEIPISDEFRFTESDKIISYYDVARKRWILLGAGGKSSVTGNVTEYDAFTRFGEYSILAESEPLALKYASVLPNPFSPQIAPVKIGYYLTSDAPPATVTIKIYNINGELVKTLLENDVQYPGRYGSASSLKEITWDGTTDGGFEARNGRYIVRITAQDGNNTATKLLQVILIK